MKYGMQLLFRTSTLQKRASWLEKAANDGAMPAANPDEVAAKTEAALEDRKKLMDFLEAISNHPFQPAIQRLHCECAATDCA